MTENQDIQDAAKIEVSPDHNSDGHRHGQHEAVLNRLARIEGHVRGIKRMVEEDVPCPDVLVQIAAVRSALNNVGRIILEDHIQSCIVDAVHHDDYKEAMRDLKMSLDKFVG